MVGLTGSTLFPTTCSPDPFKRAAFTIGERLHHHQTEVGLPSPVCSHRLYSGACSMSPIRKPHDHSRAGRWAPSPDPHLVSPKHPEEKLSGDRICWRPPQRNQLPHAVTLSKHRGRSSTVTTEVTLTSDPPIRWSCDPTRVKAHRK